MMTIGNITTDQMLDSIDLRELLIADHRRAKRNLSIPFWENFEQPVFQTLVFLTV